QKGKADGRGGGIRREQVGIDHLQARERLSLGALEFERVGDLAGIGVVAELVDAGFGGVLALRRLEAGRQRGRRHGNNDRERLNTGGCDHHDRGRARPFADDFDAAISGAGLGDVGVEGVSGGGPGHDQLNGLLVTHRERSLSRGREGGGGPEESKAPEKLHFFATSKPAWLVMVWPSNWKEHNARYFPGGRSAGYSAENSRRSPGRRRCGANVALPTRDPPALSTAAVPSGKAGSAPVLAIHWAMVMLAESVAGLTRTT